MEKLTPMGPPVIARLKNFRKDGADALCLKSDESKRLKRKPQKKRSSS